MRGPRPRRTPRARCPRCAEARREPTARLTARQLLVARMVAEGATNRESEGPWTR
ncbi:hypothetical protein ABZ379_28905 [Streptomyces canus]|uniref:hypothetical protein n=1 Tax=Streptomyces canus TaxID=58343 RepID=UPI0033CB253B